MAQARCENRHAIARAKRQIDIPALARIAHAMRPLPPAADVRRRTRGHIPSRGCPGRVPSIRRRIRASSRNLSAASGARAAAIVRRLADVRRPMAPRCGVTDVATPPRHDCFYPADDRKRAPAKPIRCASAHAPRGTPPNRLQRVVGCPAPLAQPPARPARAPRTRQSRDMHAPHRMQIAVRRPSARATPPRCRPPSDPSPQARQTTDRSIALPPETPPTNTPAHPHKAQAPSPRTVDAIRRRQMHSPGQGERRPPPMGPQWNAGLASLPSRCTPPTRPRQGLSPQPTIFPREAPTPVATTRHLRPTQAAPVS